MFRFDEENDHNQDPRILDSMLDIIGLSPLADEELSLRRGEEFAEYVPCVSRIFSRHLILRLGILGHGK